MGRIGDILSALFLIPFGFALFFGGCWITYEWIVEPLVLLDRSRGWTETPAQIQHLEVKRSTDGRTYHLAMRYQYEFNGNTYTSERFTPFSGADNDSKKHYGKYDHYKPFFQKKQPVPCWVDPADPAEAVIDRTPRFGDIMTNHLATFTFPLVGLFCMLGGVWGLRRTPPPDANSLRVTYHTAPLYFSAVPVALYLSYAVFLFSMLIRHTPPWYVWCLFLPPLLLAYFFFCHLARHKGLNGAYLDFTSPPLVGAVLSGAVRIPAPLVGECNITARCERVVGRGKGSNHTVLWKSEGVSSTAMPDGYSVSFPLHIPLPLGLPPSTPPDANPRVTWEVRVKVKHWGGPHTLTFEVPVRLFPPSLTT